MSNKSTQYLSTTQCLYSLAIRKLFALVNGKCSSESSDSPMNQEVLLGGHLYLMALKVKHNIQVYKVMQLAGKVG